MPIILENDSSDSNGQDSVDLEDGIISDPDDSGSEDELVNHLVEEIHQQISHYYARDGQIWSKEPIAQHATGRVQVHNLVREQQGPTLEVLRICANNPADSFKVFLTPEIVNIIVVCTNRGLLQINNWQNTDEVEIYSFFGLLLLIEAYKDKNASVPEMWSETDGRPVYRIARSPSRFKERLRCIRFDVRAERNRNDKLAPIRRIFEMMATKFRSSYRAGVNITVDEQLMTYRGRYPFKMFLKEKPGKYV